MAQSWQVNRQLALSDRQLFWYRRRDSNPHCLVSKTSASSRWATPAEVIFIPDFHLRHSANRATNAANQLAIGNQKSEIFWRTWHDLNVRPRPSQGRALISAELQVQNGFRIWNFEMRIFAIRETEEIRNPNFAIRNSDWRKARESNPTRTKPPQFSRLLDSLYCRAFQNHVG
jgi:hypothetical protein